MAHAEILTTQAMHTLRQLHAELGGKIIGNKLEADRLRLQMQQVEAVMKMLDPGCDLRPIAVRRKKANPWFKKGQGYRGAIIVERPTIICHGCSRSPTTATAHAATNNTWVAVTLNLPLRASAPKMSAAAKAVYGLSSNFSMVCITGSP